MIRAMPERGLVGRGTESSMHAPESSPSDPDQCFQLTFALILYFIARVLVSTEQMMSQASRSSS